jgi:superfamily II DNA or RNA helicase
MICGKGYKVSLESSEIQKLKKELKVSPFIPGCKYPQYYIMYRVSSNSLYIPKFYGLKTLGTPEKIVEQCGEEYSFKINGEPRDYQKEPIDKIYNELTSNNSCIASLYTGWGKTFAAIYLIYKLGLKSIIIVNKESLLQQWDKQIRLFLGIVPSIIQGKIVDTSSVVSIGMIQSISTKNYPKDTFSKYGLCIYDEVHHNCSKVFSNVFYKIGTKYNLGLTATITRADKLEYVIEWFLGKIIVNVKQITILPSVKVYNYYPDKPFEGCYLGNGKVNTPATVTKTLRDPQRDSFIINKIKELYSENRNILVLSDRREHCENLGQLLNGYSVGLYLGGMKNELLEESNTKRIILATYQMASEGYDNPKLDTLVLASPKKNIEQATGRILRRENKNYPLIIDINDIFQIFTFWAKGRTRFYKQKGIKIELCGKKTVDLSENDEIKGYSLRE